MTDSSSKRGMRFKSSIPSFHMIANDIWKYELSPYEYVAYGRVIFRAGNDSTCFESQANMAKACGMSTTQLKRALQSLRERGLISIESGKARGETNVISAAYPLPEVGGGWTTQVGGVALTGLGGSPDRSTNKTPDQDSSKSLGEPPKAARKRDLLFEAICEVTGTDYRNLTKTARGAVNACRAELAAVGATPQEVRERAAAWPLAFPEARLTPSALAKWWPSLQPARKRVKDGGDLCLTCGQMRAMHNTSTDHEFKE